MKKYILVEAILIVILIIARLVGAINPTRLGEIMIGLGIVSLVVGVLSLLGTRVFTGDVSLFLPLNELAAIDSLKSRHSIYYVLEVIGLGAIPLAVGILVLQFL